MRPRPTLLRPQRKRILLLPSNVIFLRHVFRGLRHRIHAVLALHQRIHKPPPNRRVVNLRLAAESLLRLPHHKRRPRHALHAARNHHLRLATLDRPRRNRHRLHARSAQPVHRRPGNFLRHSREQQRHARHIAIIFPSLIRAPVDHVIHRRPIHANVALHQRPNRNRRQIIRPHRRERPAKPPERRPHRIANKNFAHSHLR